MSDSDPRRSACDELAQLLATPAGARTARLLQLSEAMTTSEPPLSEAPHAAEGARGEPRAISIWRPLSRGGDLLFERPEPLLLGDHYATTRFLRRDKRPGVERVCFFGESVAAGYLYAPRLTPAGVLQRRLSDAAGRDAFEVIDLARTNETLQPLVTTIERSLQLEPDLLVIFAGNNWNLLETPSLSPYVPSVRGRQRYALALRRGGIAGPARLGRRQIRKKADKALAAITRLTEPAGIPVVWVIPEVNLADWEDRQPVTWLPGDGSARWHESYAEATDHLATRRHAAALRVADAMLLLDGGRCSSTHRLRARALTGLARADEARQACEAEVRSSTYPTLAFLGAPRATIETQALLRRQAERRGFSIVDLPKIFAEHTASPLPGHRLFLDYCHLSAEGIELAMHAVATEILRLRDMDPPPQRPGAEPAAQPAVEALARLGAAAHSAHRLLTVGSKQRHLLHWCRRALAADPAVADAMVDLLVARSAPCPAVLTAAQQRNLYSPHRWLLQHGWRWSFLDVELIEAVCTALAEAGRCVRDEIDRRLLRHHAVGARGVELTRPPYLWEPLERFFPEATAAAAMTGRATHRCPWPEACFCLIAEAGQSVVLELTARLPAIAAAPAGRAGRLTLSLNRHPVATMEVEEVWTRGTFRLPRRRLERAINRISVAWPPLPDCGDAAIENVIRRLENGHEADLHPVFGEIFSLRARTSEEASQEPPPESATMLSSH